MHLTAILLAAGQSRRMEAVNKLLLPLDGQPLVAHVLATLSAAAVEDVVVVTGHEREALDRVLRGFPVRAVHNAHFAEGMATSITCGVDASAPGTDGYLICLGDMPFVASQTIAQLRWTFFEAERPSIVVPVAEGRRGHPILFDVAFRDDLRQLSGDSGARSIVEAHPETVVELAVQDRAIFEDIDTRAIYERLLRRSEARS